MPRQRSRHVKQRPVYLDLPRIRLPLPGIVSILHRASGALLVSGRDPAAAVRGVERASPPPEALRGDEGESFAIRSRSSCSSRSLWAYLHHFCAGIRYLLLDIHRGIELAPARRSSAVVLVLSLALTLILGARLW